MDEAVAVEEAEGEEEGVGEFPDELEREASELVLFDQLVQVDAEDFERDADVVAKSEMVQHQHSVAAPVRIQTPQMVQNTNLLFSLPMKSNKNKILQGKIS